MTAKTLLHKNKKDEMCILGSDKEVLEASHSSHSLSSHS